MKKASELIMDCMKARGLFQSEVSKRLGEKPQNLNLQLLHRQDMKVGRFTEIMESMGYEVTLRYRGFSKVTPQYADDVTRTHLPIGRFWYRAGNLYVGIDNQHGEALTDEFSSFEDMEKWFHGETCVTPRSG